MSTRLFSFLLALSIFVSACGNSQKPAADSNNFTEEQLKAQEEAFQKMMSIHDEVMPKLDDINRVGRNLKPYLDSLEDKSVKEEINLALKNMETAEDHMMEWMMASPKMGQLRDSLSNEAIIGLLQAEEQKISKVRDDMMNSLQAAEQLLARIQENNKTE